ncbi:MAG TPA: hypothetical protein VF544_14640 [Pyrinomonadaceae bacterium]|jgi:hypothetical protein
MKHTKSFFKREATATMLFNLALPVAGLLFILIIMCWRWLAR